MMPYSAELDFLAGKGLVFPDGTGVLENDALLASDAIAMDAMPELSTTASAGIPAFMTSYVDPKLINVVFTPMRGADLGGEVKKGDWTTTNAIFPMIEVTGEVSSYGDWNNNGQVNLNPTFPDRQSYHYQVFAKWGERQLDMAGKARIQWAAGLRQAAALKLNKFQNQTYFYGIAGLRNYGYLNDPSLPASIVPETKAAGGTGWTNATSVEMQHDVIALINQLREQSGGIVDTDSNITIGLSPTSSGKLTIANEYGKSALDMLKASYPNLRFVQAVEFGDVAGMTVQAMLAMAEDIDGQKTAEAAFTEKLRAHAVVTENSGWSQKMSQGTYGAIIYMPLGIATMAGI
ncbi:major capsid family protein [Gluconobacter oxydans]|uniref:major capsid family protein n=1 Tax=Gluconobacter oxydans TaxID=442 RepID=UPI0006992F36